MKSILSFSLLIVLSCALFTGCAKKVDTATGPPPKVADPTLSQAEADKRIKDVQNNKSIPENAKPGITAAIQGRVK